MIYKRLLKENPACSFHLLMFSGGLTRGSLIALGFWESNAWSRSVLRVAVKVRRWLKRTQSVCRQTSSQARRQSITNEVWNGTRRATWVRGVKFSGGEEDYKNTNCCSTCGTQFFRGRKWVQELSWLHTASPQRLQPSTHSRTSCDMYCCAAPSAAGSVNRRLCCCFICSQSQNSNTSSVKH